MAKKIPWNHGHTEKPKLIAKPTKSAAKKSARKNLYYMSLIPVIIVIIAVVAQYIYHYYYYLPRRIALKTDLSVINTAIDEQSWGTYRSHLYFGLRAMHPHSPLFGMMWYQQPDYGDGHPRIRHWCDQGDGLEKYAWLAADGRTFGRQMIQDGAMYIFTDWLNNGPTWSARITAAPNSETQFALLFYFALQDSDSHLDASYVDGELDHLQGWTSKLGDFSISFDPSVNVKSRSYVAYKTETAPDVTLLKEVVLSSTVLDQETQLLQLSSGLFENKLMRSPNLVVLQYNILTNSTVEITFSKPGKDALHGNDFSNELAKRESAFNKKFEKTYRLSAKDYPVVYQEIGRVALSNMLGTIGYSFGYNRVLSAYAKEPTLYGPHALLATCPSRAVFPRGFLWDEGFHHMLFRRFDPELSLKIIASWLNTMNIDGWIPREMILDYESEKRVPEQFIIQRDSVANPPMLFFLIEKYLDDDKGMREYADLLRTFYPRLRLWYNWLNETQVGKLPGTFRWRGRNVTTDLELNPKTLPSGLDDYPRATHPNEQEYHVDLHCWMALSARVLSRLARLVGDEVNEVIYANDYGYLSDNALIDRLYWSKKKQRYCDYGLHSTNVKLQRIIDSKLLNQNPHLRAENFPKKRIVVSPPKLGLVENVFGYISLFPILLRLVSHDSDKLGIILKNIRAEKGLWTDFGLRSIAPSSPYYGAYNTEHDPPYWRGTVWININYMMISALKHYSSFAGPNRELAYTLYSELRNNVVANVAKEFRRTGFFWEQYNDKDGHGQGAHPFTGWSSLCLAIMAEQYD